MKNLLKDTKLADGNCCSTKSSQNISKQDFTTDLDRQFIILVVVFTLAFLKLWDILMALIKFVMGVLNV